MTRLSALSILWRAALIGSADIVPGVSGGTMALITGVYERLTTLITSLSRLPQRVFSSRSLKPFTTVDWRFASLLTVGVILAFAVASRLLPPLIIHYPGPVYALFVGLILATAVILILQHLIRAQHVLTGLIGLTLGLAVMFLPHSVATPNTLMMIALGVAAGFVMLLPGVSGSYLLLVTGYYALLLTALATPFSHLHVLIPFALGVLGGILIAALTVTSLLKWQRDHTMVFLAGIMLGALINPLLLIAEHTTTPMHWLVVSALALLGVLIAWLLQQKASVAAT